MKKILIILGIIVLGVIGFFGYQQFKGKSSQNLPVTNAAYTLAEIATHNSSSSCWVAVNGKVYDLTNWINQHPGGADNILGICGTDGTAAFEAQHNGQGEPAKKLDGFAIGVLKP